jgi:hypothetical protein
LRSRNRESPVPPARRDQHLLILKLLARVEYDHAGCHIHHNDAALEPLHIMLVIPTGRSDIPPVEILLRAEIGLRKRRTTESRPRLSADEHDAALEALFAERHRGVATGEPAADHHNRPIAASCVQRSHRKHCTRRPSSRHRACAGVP